jgi:hypothetical protein
MSKLQNYRLTASFKKENGVILPKGMTIAATAEEIQQRKIPAEPIDGPRPKAKNAATKKAEDTPTPKP